MKFTTASFPVPNVARSAAGTSCSAEAGASAPKKSAGQFTATFTATSEGTVTESETEGSMVTAPLLPSAIVMEATPSGRLSITTEPPSLAIKVNWPSRKTYLPFVIEMLSPTLKVIPSGTLTEVVGVASETTTVPVTALLIAVEALL